MQDTEEFRVRVDRSLLKAAKDVADDIGTTPGEAVRLLFSQMVKVRGLPFRPSAFPALEEYGASLADADAAEERTLREIQADRKAGKVVRFTGKLP